MAISHQSLPRDWRTPYAADTGERRAPPLEMDAGRADRCRLAVLVSRQERWSNWLGWAALGKRVRRATEQFRRRQTFRIRPS